MQREKKSSLMSGWRGLTCDPGTIAVDPFSAVKSVTRLTTFVDKESGIVDVLRHIIDILHENLEAEQMRGRQIHSGPRPGPEVPVAAVDIVDITDIARYC